MPFFGKCCIASKSNSSSGVTPVTSDPVSPTTNEQWILEKDLSGQQTGLLVSLVYSTLTKYQLCQNTANGIIRTNGIYVR